MKRHSSTRDHLKLVGTVWGQYEPGWLWSYGNSRSKAFETRRGARAVRLQHRIWKIRRSA